MTQDEIIRMAREAGFPDPAVSINWLKTLERFAALVAAHERDKQVEQEPVAWRVRGYSQFKTGNPAPWRYVDGAYKPSVNNPDCCDFTPLYTRPVRTKDLTDDEIEAIFKSHIGKQYDDFARAVIAKFKEKNK